MRNALLVAGREYADNARTKGFWLNLLMFPMILIAAVKVPALLEEKAAPTRPFMLVDQSGEYREVIEQALERSYQRKVLLELTLSPTRPKQDLLALGALGALEGAKTVLAPLAKSGRLSKEEAKAAGL